MCLRETSRASQAIEVLASQVGLGKTDLTKSLLQMNRGYTHVPGAQQGKNQCKLPNRAGGWEGRGEGRVRPGRPVPSRVRPGHPRR